MARRARSLALQVEQLEDRLTPAGSVIPAGEFNWLQYSPTGELGELVWNGSTLVYRSRVANSWQAAAVASSGSFTQAQYNSADEVETASQTAQLVFTSDGTPHALFLEKQWNGNVGKYQTFIQHYARTSTGWHKVETITPNWTSQWGPNNLVAEAGPNNSIHLIFTETNAAATGVGNFGTGVLSYATNASGHWTFSKIADTADLSQDVWFTGGRWAPRFLSLAVDSSNKAYVTYTPKFFIAGAFSTVSSTLMYATNKGGSWASQVVMSPTDGTADAGLGAGVAVSPTGQVAVASYYVDRFNTGSPQTAQLMYHTLTASGWTHTVVASTPDGYVAGDGAKFTGFAPSLSFNSSGKPTIVFSDEAGEHLPVSFANEFAGQIRVATLNGSSWSFQTVFRQTDPIHNQLFYPVVATYKGQTTYAGLVATSTVDGNKNPTRTDFTVIDVGAPHGLTAPPVSISPPPPPPPLGHPLSPPPPPPTTTTTTTTTVPAAPEGAAHPTNNPTGWAVAVDNGPSASQVFSFRADGSLATVVMPYGPDYHGGVRFARADFTGDGVPDLITVPGAGIEASARIWDGATGNLLAEFSPFPGYTGGLWVALGDVDGDGVNDLAFGTDGGTLPLVAVYSGRDGHTIASFLPYPDGTPGGARLAIGDVNHDGYADIVTALGVGTPIISVFDGRSLALGYGVQRAAPDFYLYPTAFQLGVNIAVGDADGDGYADIIGGPSIGPAYMRVVSGKALTTGQGQLDLVSALLWPNTDSGIRFAAVDANGDGRADIMATPGGAAGGYVALYAAPKTPSVNFTDPTLFDPLPGLTTGLFVG
jgi:hypothetical protein